MGPDLFLSRRNLALGGPFCQPACPDFHVERRLLQPAGRRRRQHLRSIPRERTTKCLRNSWRHESNFQKNYAQGASRYDGRIGGGSWKSGRSKGGCINFIR